MRRFFTISILVLTILALARAVPARAGDRNASDIQDLLRPGPEHALLQKLAGIWDATFIASDPSGKEVRTSGTKTTTKHSAYHTVDDFDGELMGMRMIGHGINGYCAVRKQYFTLWTDSMTPSPMILYGDYDASKRELSMSGECFGPSGKLEKCRAVTRFVDDDHVVWTLFGVMPNGTQTALVRAEYTRRR